MRPHQLRHAGTIAFPREIRLDFDALPEIVAITGKTGAGKTTLLDLIPGALFLNFSYRSGPLYRHFATKGFIELTWSTDDGRRFRSMVRVDPDLEKVEANLFPDPPTETNRHIAGPLTRDYLKRIEEIVGAEETFLASAYAVQNGSGNFLKADRADRRAIMGELLGLQLYARHAAVAKDAADKESSRLSAVRIELRSIEQRIQDAGNPEAKRSEIQERLTVIQRDLADGRAQLTTLNEAAAQARERVARLDPLRDRIRPLEQAIANAEREISDSQKRIENNKEVQSRRDEIMAAVELSTALELEKTNLNTDLEEAHILKNNLQAEISTLSSALQTARTQEQKVINSIADARTRVRIIDSVPCHAEGEYASCEFITSAVSQLAEIPELERMQDVFHNEVAIADSRYHVLSRSLSEASNSITDFTRRISDINHRLVAANKVSQEAFYLEAASARIEELHLSIERSQATITTSESELAGIRSQLQQGEPLAEEQRQAQKAANDMERKTRELGSDVSRLERELGSLDVHAGSLKKDRDRHAELTVEAETIYRELSDWTLIAKACAPAGIPALKMDVQLPEISTRSTELLRDCFGHQLFTISMISQRPTADESKLKEVLDVVIHRDGKEMDAKHLSGGEFALASEAIGVSIALSNQGQKRTRLLMRDEVSSPLDATTTAPAYVTMLRRVAKLGGFSHILFITHQPETKALADTVIHVANESLSIQS